MKPDQPAAPPEPRETVAYAELLKLAHEEGLKSIVTELLLQPSDTNGRLAIVKASVETEKGHFEALGDADPNSVDEFLAPHLIRVAETRAKARALRDAVNCGIVSYEELDGVSRRSVSRPGPGATSRSNGHGRAPARPRTSGTAAPPNGNGSSDPMTEGQRRYLFRLMAAQGLQREAAENRIKELFEVSSLTAITKTGAMEMIDRLLTSAAPGDRGGRERSARH